MTHRNSACRLSSSIFPENHLKSRVGSAHQSPDRRCPPTSFSRNSRRECWASLPKGLHRMNGTSHPPMNVGTIWCLATASAVSTCVGSLICLGAYAENWWRDAPIIDMSVVLIAGLCPLLYFLLFDGTRPISAMSLAVVVATLLGYPQGVVATAPSTRWEQIIDKPFEVFPPATSARAVVVILFLFAVWISLSRWRMDQVGRKAKKADSISSDTGASHAAP